MIVAVGAGEGEIAHMVVLVLVPVEMPAAGEVPHGIPRHVEHASRQVVALVGQLIEQWRLCESGSVDVEREIGVCLHEQTTEAVCARA